MLWGKEAPLAADRPGILYQRRSKLPKLLSIAKSRAGKAPSRDIATMKASNATMSREIKALEGNIVTMSLDVKAAEGDNEAPSRHPKPKSRDRTTV